jgi:hypothetical protein
VHERILHREHLDTMTIAEVDQTYRAELAHREAELRARERAQAQAKGGG